MPVAVVTGAASGIGRATAIALATNLEARVALLDTNTDGLAETQRRLPAGPALCIQCDVRDEDSVRDALAHAADELREPASILVNSAGVCLNGESPGQDGPAHRLELDTWNFTIGVNLTGCFLLAKHALPVMRQQGYGCIVNVASVGGTFFGTHNHAYAASKAGVAGLTRSMAAQYGPEGIRTNAVCPGPIDTPLSQMARAEGEQHDRWLRGIPLRRIGQPEDIGNTIAFLASDKAAFMNGSIVVADGGMVVA